MTGLLRTRHNGLRLKRVRRVNVARQIIAAGLVDTGSEWDGVHIREVYRHYLSICASRPAALDHLRALWTNRVAAYREGKINYQAGIQAYEYEPELAYFEDEVAA